jgi:galactonate dehydratase
MKITDIEAHVRGDILLVVVRTDSGLHGWGESACWAYPAAVAAVVEKFALALRGADPRRIENHWQRMWRMGPFRSALISAAVSAVDTALWDLKGKALGAPVHELLGGPCRDRIRLHRIIDGADAEALAAAGRAAADEGFTALKFDPLEATWIEPATAAIAERARERTTALREAVGPGVDLIVEVHRSLTPHQIPALLDAVRPLAPLFVEDPIQIDTFDVQAGLVRHGVPLGLGERWQSVWEVREALAVAGPFTVRSDVALAGGITAARKIAAVAEAHHAQVSWHNWLGAVSDAATASVDAAIPNLLTHEHAPEQFEKFGDAVQTAWLVDDGHLVVPDAPGLGVDVDLDRLPARVEVLGRELHEIPERADGSIAFAL